MKTEISNIREEYSKAIDELKEEIDELRNEVKELKDKKKNKSGIKIYRYVLFACVCYVCKSDKGDFVICVSCKLK